LLDPDTAIPQHFVPPENPVVTAPSLVLDVIKTFQENRGTRTLLHKLDSTRMITGTIHQIQDRHSFVPGQLRERFLNAIPEFDMDRLLVAWQEAVFALYLAEGKIEPEVAQ
jgi:hypothetical protein